MSELSASLGTKLDKADVVDPGAEAEAGQAADAKSTYEGLNRVLGVASDARVLAESKADQSALEAHVASTNNPHAVTASQVGAYTKDETNTRLDAKADRATTLEGYGITNAATKEELAAKADLMDGKVPASQLPSYVDDVLEYDTMSGFPATGESSKIYVAKDTNLVYRWSGTQYVEISPSPVLDDTVTEESPNGVKSSGIWSWVKSLLPNWLTGDYAEPATVASVANKRDKSDRAVYPVTRTENTDWTWTSENKELEAALNEKRIKILYGNDTIMWSVNEDPSPHWSYTPSRGNEDDLSVVMYFAHDNDFSNLIPATATRPRYMDEALGPAKQDQQIAAVATDDAAKPADGSLMKYDAENDRFVKAVEGVDYLKTHQDISGKFDATHDFNGESALLRWEAFYLAVYAPYGLYVLRGGIMADEHDQHGQYVRTHSLEQKADRATTLAGYGITDGATKTELAAKRDLADNVCRKTEFTEWICNPPRTEFGGVYSIRYDSEVKVYTLCDNGVGFEEIGSPTDDKLNLEFVGYCTATRSAVCTSNEYFITKGYVDGEVSSAVSTNNPAFVSAVQNTPAPEPGQGEDPPWGTWGTVSAAIAGLVEGLEWIKNILGSVASGYSTFAEWIASKYTKPSGGIPASDLAPTVQSSLDAADAAAPQATTYTKDETDAAILAGASLGQMTNLGNGRYEYTGALADASTQTYPREVA